ncbi:MAG: hypothetical protein JWQ76_468 [Ramlibacter sp.]|nr:hypothetical protein [Ramlibacter sp.]
MKLHDTRLRRTFMLAAVGFTAAIGVAYALQPAAGNKEDPARRPAYRTIGWDELVPKEWDPLKRFRGADLGSMQDNDPRAAEMLRLMQDAWNNAPVNNALQDQPVRIPGFVVPLESAKAGLQQFLLVPYFGACIHVPPPPSNQIIDVKLRQPNKKVEMMDAVWVTGRIRLVRSTTAMGTSGYSMDAAEVEPYTEKAR